MHSIYILFRKIIDVCLGTCCVSDSTEMGCESLWATLSSCALCMLLWKRARHFCSGRSSSQFKTRELAESCCLPPEQALRTNRSSRATSHKICLEFSKWIDAVMMIQGGVSFICDPMREISITCINCCSPKTTTQQMSLFHFAVPLYLIPFLEMR